MIYTTSFLQDIDLDLGLPATVGTLRGSIKLNRYANIMPCNNIISFFKLNCNGFTMQMTAIGLCSYPLDGIQTFKQTTSMQATSMCDILSP